MEIGTAANTAFDPIYKGAVGIIDQKLDNPAKGGSAMGNVSRDALLLAEALRTAQNAPDTRQRRIEELRAMIASGVYKPNARQIANALIRDNPGLFRFF